VKHLLGGQRRTDDVPVGQRWPVAPIASRVARRERRRDRSRDEILGATRSVLLREGIAGTTLDAVAREVGVSKTALYYYFPSKDALLFELVFGNLQAQAQAVHDAVEVTATGADALAAILRVSTKTFATRLDDFRLAFLHGQVAGNGAMHFDGEQFARIRPLNDLWFAGATKRLGDQHKKRSHSAPIEPRLLAFLAWVASIGLLTVKGMVENHDDPLIYSDDQLIDAMSRVFAAAAAA
jgi:AcrR family transcriptional regulator